MYFFALRLKSSPGLYDPAWRTGLCVSGTSALVLRSAWPLIPLPRHLFHLVLRRYNLYFLLVSRNAYLSLITLPCLLVTTSSATPRETVPVYLRLPSQLLPQRIKDICLHLASISPITTANKQGRIFLLRS